MKPPTWAKNATPPPLRRWQRRGRSPLPRAGTGTRRRGRYQAGISIGKTSDEREHLRKWIEDEVGAHDGGDRPAGAEVGDLRRCRAPEQQRHQRLGHHRRRSPPRVEAEIAKPAVRVLDVLPEDREEEHVAEDMVPAPVEEHRGDPADAPGLRPVAGSVHRARIERRVVDGRVQVRELVEDPHCEVGGDQPDVDDREALRRNSVRERKHALTIPCARCGRVGVCTERLRQNCRSAALPPGSAAFPQPVRKPADSPPAAAREEWDRQSRLEVLDGLVRAAGREANRLGLQEVPVGSRAERRPVHRARCGHPDLAEHQPVRAHHPRRCLHGGHRRLRPGHRHPHEAAASAGLARLRERDEHRGRHSRSRLAEHRGGCAPLRHRRLRDRVRHRHGRGRILASAQQRRPGTAPVQRLRRDPVRDRDVREPRRRCAGDTRPDRRLRARHRSQRGRDGDRWEAVGRVAVGR